MLAPTRESPTYTTYRMPPAWRPPDGGPARRLATRSAIRARRCVGGADPRPDLVLQARSPSRRTRASLSTRWEWLRDNGARGLVNRVENFYYSLTAPARADRRCTRCPARKAPSPRRRRTTPSFTTTCLRRSRPSRRTGLPGEGTWQRTFAGAASEPPVLITSFRPEPVDYPQAVVGVAWINHAVTSKWNYPGSQEPAVSLPSRGPEEVPALMRSKLVATFQQRLQAERTRAADLRLEPHLRAVEEWLRGRSSATPTVTST